MVYDRNLLWVLQQNHPDRAAIIAVADILDDLGVRRLGVEIDLSSLVLPLIPGLQPGDHALCYGPSFIRRLDHSDPQWRIGSLFDPATFLWSQFQSHWAGLMLSEDGQVVSAQELRACLPQQTIFIRPNADSKRFDGGLYAPADLEILLARLEPHLSVVWARPTAVDAEYRIFIVGDEVVAASQYRDGGKPSITGHVPNPVIDLALAANALWQPREAYVLDIARSGDRLGIVEANCITAARFYAANARAVITALCALGSRLTGEP